MDAKIRSFSIFLNGKKFGVAQGHAYDVETGSELQMGDGQVLGVASGVPTTQIVTDTIVLYGGDSNVRQLEEAALQHKMVQVGVGIVNGRIHKIDMYCSKFSYKGDTVKGTCTGTFTFIGGAPTFEG